MKEEVRLDLVEDRDLPAPSCKSGKVKAIESVEGEAGESDSWNGSLGEDDLGVSVRKVRKRERSR